MGTGGMNDRNVPSMKLRVLLLSHGGVAIYRLARPMGGGLIGIYGTAIVSFE
jgi:hypothetical protein